MQALEGELDSTHVYFLHGRLREDIPGRYGLWIDDRAARFHVTPTDYGLVYGAELTWVGSCGTDVLDNPLAGHLLHLGQTGTWAKIGITPMLGLQLLDVGYPAHFYTENQTSYLVGPVVVEVEHVLREYQDTDRIRLFDFDEQAEIDYWVPDLDPLELDTYARLRRDGFQVGAARTAVQLITA